MVKKMIYLDEPRQRLLKRIASEEQASETEVVRRALDHYALARSKPDPLLELIGMLGGGDPDGSSAIDQVIVEAIDAKLARGRRSKHDPPEQEK